MRRSEQDVERMIDQEQADYLSTGRQIRNVSAWRSNCRQRMLENGRHLNALPGGSPGITGTVTIERIPAVVAFRRLYEAKVGELTRYGVRERDRIPIAVDYAASEVWRCAIEPMPPGGVTKLEDDLYAELGYDRSTGLRFPPRESVG